VRLLLLDNYDSFTWNLAQYLEELGAEVRVELNDRVGVEWVERQAFDALVVSPGPGRPEGAGISLDLIRWAAGRKPLLGVCLGHQALAQAYGGRIVRAPSLMHGKTSRIRHDGAGIFAGLPAEFEATRYHSLVVDPASLHEDLRVTAWADEDVIMGIEHRRLPLHGVQFHPESILTLEGKALLANYLELAAGCLPAPTIDGK
jgi:anthranilate synthase component 2